MHMHMQVQISTIMVTIPSRRYLLKLVLATHPGWRIHRPNIRELPETLGLLALLAWMGRPDSLDSLYPPVSLVSLVSLVPQPKTELQIYHITLLLRKDEYQTVVEVFRTRTTRIRKKVQIWRRHFPDINRRWLLMSAPSRIVMEIGLEMEGVWNPTML
jgi:hypothetical protein